MIDVKHMTRQLELSFWSMAIPMLSNSKTLHRLLPALYDFFLMKGLSSGMKKAVVCSLSGFVIGILISFTFS
jgi:hypothetical protein